MSFFTILMLLILNLYIGYNIVISFKGDGWSFMGGLFISVSYIITIPALIFSILSIRIIQNNSSKKLIFPIIFGIIGTLMGFLLYNAISWWFFIVLFNVLLLISAFICNKVNHKTINTGSKNILTADKIPLSDINSKHTRNTRNTTYNISIIFQSIGLILLFILAISSIFASSDSIENFNYKQQIISICIFGFLFLLHSTVTFAFSKKKTWALNFKYIESYILLGLSILIFLSAVISEGISLTNTFIASLLFFTLLILLFIYMIHNYKKLKKSGIFILLFIFIFVVPNISVAQETKKINDITLLDNHNVYFPYIEFYSTDITDFFNPENTGKYPSTNLFDGYLKTCWLAGSTNKSNALYVKVPNKIPLNKLTLNIFSGYGKSEKLYYANARPKKIRISIFSAYEPEGYATEVAVNYKAIKYPSEKYIEIADTFGVQSFPLNINKKDLFDFRNINLKECKESLNDYDVKIKESFILKLEIVDVYKGSKYDDVCISEIFFNDRFVTHYPDKYNQINNVYIKDENTILADYYDKKGVIIYKDTSSVFTMIDWDEHSNWAILHYVKNDAVGQNSRIEESYLLIDLKNRKNVNDEFEKCTGILIYSPVIEKDRNGDTFLDTFDKYKVELK